jgi:hypothetical protein
METKHTNTDYLDESQSLHVIKEMIQVSQKKLKNDGILFILWGWVSFVTYLFEYLVQTFPHTYHVTLFKKYTSILLSVFALVYTLVYLIRQSRKATTYIGISLRYVWIYMFASMVLINLIQANVLHTVNFELQLPIFMVLISFAIVVTGGILRYKMVLAGGIVFGLLAYLSSCFSLQHQLLVEAIAWLVGFVIPGHYLYANRNR